VMAATGAVSGVTIAPTKRTIGGRARNDRQDRKAAYYVDVRDGK
jgi:hypothetical protein